MVPAHSASGTGNQTEIRIASDRQRLRRPGQDTGPRLEEMGKDFLEEETGSGKTGKGGKTANRRS